MNNMAVIGVGNLGARHLESLYRSDLPLRLFAVDPSEDALKAAAKILGDLREPEASARVSFCHSLDELPTSLDLVIIATNADIRLSVLQALLERCQPRFVILEKVLFQRPDDYVKCEALLSRHNVQAFVNCPRRTYDIYRTIKERFQGAEIDLLNVAGGQWGLGCNSIHFVDLFSFLTDKPVETYTLLLDPEVRSSKRKGFIEFTGSIRGSSASGTLLLSSAGSSFQKLYITILAGNLSCTVDEAEGSARLFDQYQLVEEIKFTVPWQSKLTATVAEELLSEGRCGLPTYAESSMSHVPFIEALLAYCRQQINSTLDHVPIT